MIGWISPEELQRYTQTLRQAHRKHRVEDCGVCRVIAVMQKRVREEFADRIRRGLEMAEETRRWGEEHRRRMNASQ